MKVVASAGRDDIAVVYVVELSSGRKVECVESLQPPLSRERKWVLLVSTLFGCPIGCKMCDAGGHYTGKPTAEEIFEQVDFLVRRRFPDRRVPSQQFKIQFARMGEPALNPHVLTVLEGLPRRYHAPGLMPSLSTIAPAGAGRFFESLIDIKRRLYGDGRFQFQFSIHTTDERLRRELIPVKTWDFRQMAEYGARWFDAGDRKVTLNFALAQGMPIDPDALLRYFSPDNYVIKITPLNPTYRAIENGLASYLDPMQAATDSGVVVALRQAGYEVIVSIGEVEENRIGSNCGQYLKRHLAAPAPIPDGYTYDVRALPD